MKKPTRANVNALSKKVTLEAKDMKSLVGGEFKDSVRTAREHGSRAV